MSLDLSGFATDIEVVATFIVPGTPAAKERPRVGNGNTYTPRATLDAEGKVGWAFRAATRGHRPDGASEFGLVIAYHTATRRRRDIDNMEKLVLDALSGLVYRDDTQVVEVHHRKALDPQKRGHTEVTVYRIQG